MDSTVPATLSRSSIAGAALVLTGAGLLSGCGDDDFRKPYIGGDAKIGKQLVTQYQCGACHKIPNVAGAGGQAGPDLEKFGRLSYIAGGIPNDPAHLEAWLLDPPALKPGTVMPKMGLTPQEARHMVAYLYTLR